MEPTYTLIMLYIITFDTNYDTNVTIQHMTLIILKKKINVSNKVIMSIFKKTYHHLYKLHHHLIIKANI